jgi:hypothetical protein
MADRYASSRRSWPAAKTTCTSVRRLSGPGKVVHLSNVDTDNAAIDTSAITEREDDPIERALKKHSFKILNFRAINKFILNNNHSSLKLFFEPQILILS